MQVLPIQLDVFALVMLLGVAQGLFLGLFFLTGTRAQQVSNRCLGLFMLALSAACGEIFLNYTNYTFRLLWIGDFSEPVNFILGPLFYFFVFSRIRQRLPHRWGWHLLPFIIWTINSATWLYQPVEVKYNAYVNSQHPQLPFIPEQPYWQDDFTGLRDFINEMTLLSCLVYAGLALIMIRKANRYQRAGQSNRSSLRSLSLIFAFAPLLIVLVKPQFYHDVGDYLLASYMAAMIYATSFTVMRGSNFLRDEPQNHDGPAPSSETSLIVEPKKKYEKSALSGEVEDAVIGKLNRLLEAEKPYLNSDLSLPKLAARLDTSPHNLSQLLNDRLGQTFFDWLATYRIAEAQRLLNEPTTVHLKIDEIAERVGYNSTSAFHTAFKRLTNQTPAQYRANGLGQRAES